MRLFLFLNQIVLILSLKMYIQNNNNNAKSLVWILFPINLKMLIYIYVNKQVVKIVSMKKINLFSIYVFSIHLYLSWKKSWFGHLLK